MAWEKGDLIQCDMTFVSHTIANAPDGYIAGIASTPATDLYGHKVAKGAFDESIRKKGLTGPRGIKLLAGHDWHKIAGAIKKLETVGDNLGIEAQLNLNVSYVKDLYEVTKQNGGLSFSVGFSLQSYEFVDDEEIENEDDPCLIIKSGDLMEVSVVTFPAQPEAEMTFVKVGPPSTVRELERAFIARGNAQNRSEAKKLIQTMRQFSHLLNGKETSEASPAITPQHLGLDAPLLKPVHEQLARMKAVFGSG